MTDPFFIKLVLAFSIGSVWITLATIVAEKLGTKIGGVVGGLPSTIVITLFFIGWTQSPQAAADATDLIPLGIGGATLFILIFTLLARKNFFLALVGSLSAWGLVAFAAVLLKPSFLVCLVGFFVLFLFSYYILEIKSGIKSVARQPIRYTVPILGFRGILSGAVIVSAVFIAKIGGPVIGGMFGVFPAVFLSTAIITQLTHGSGFSGAVMKVLMMTGSLTVLVYALGVRYLIVSFGLGWGSLASYGIALISALLISWFVQKKMK